MMARLRYVKFHLRPCLESFGMGAKKLKKSGGLIQPPSPGFGWVKKPSLIRIKVISLSHWLLYPRPACIQKLFFELKRYDTFYFSKIIHQRKVKIDKIL